MAQNGRNLLGDDDGPIPLYEHEIEFLEKYTNPNHVLEMELFGS